ncbi:MAG: TMEM143 family protein [Hyphomicrobiaceae bacterium]
MAAVDTALRRSSESAVSAPAVRPPTDATAADVMAEIFDRNDRREKFIPVTREALMERLTRPHSWPAQDGAEARRFFRYLDYWRQQTYASRLLELESDYEPFNPDSDLLVSRTFTRDERFQKRQRLVANMTKLLEQANYTRIDTDKVELILTTDSHYGLDLHVDLSAFDELLIFYRGASKRTESRRDIRKLYLKHEDIEVPIFQRLCVVFKLKPEEVRIREVMVERSCNRKEAEKIVKKLRSMLPPQIKSDLIYLKLFKNMPRSDIEMVFPNTRVRFRLFDKIRLGVTASSGLGMGVFGTVGKIAVASNPIALAGAMLGLCGIAFRQATSFLNQRNRYMVTMAQNLYFHALADNRGVTTLLASRAAEEDIKEEMLLYNVMAKDRVSRRDLGDVDRSIEQYLLNTFNVSVNFDLEDALSRLMADGIVTEKDGVFDTLAPNAAARHIDVKWDKYLDELPDQTRDEGVEFDKDTGEAMA